MIIRKTSTSRSLFGGCYQCYGDKPQWFGPNTQGVAARHHDATGHTTWVEIAMTVRYGDPLQSNNPPNNGLQRTAPATDIEGSNQS